jgi:triacylglycerol lipase
METKDGTKYQKATLENKLTSVNKNKKAIVFVHGILGIPFRLILGKAIHYFRSLPSHLRDYPQSIYFPRLPNGEHIETRAHVLADFLAGINADHIDLIAHSMGGLDSRYLIHHLDPHQRIRSLTTIATPHHGTPLAQWVVDNKGPLYALLRHITQPGLLDLTPVSCVRFNLEISNRPYVKYYSFAGIRPVTEIPLIFRPWARALAESNGENDSQVPVASAKWGKFKGTLNADHMELVGWNFGWPNGNNARPFDHIRFYCDLIQELSAN